LQVINHNVCKATLSIIGIKTDGIVEEVLLPGIREKISRRVIQKALVKV